MSTASDKANLARIRDNQRRSRARRKEYLQELESRLRQCELQGVEASSEIQTAARRVAEENKRLRTLLSHNGVTDEGVESYLRTSTAGDSSPGYQQASHGEAAQVLEHLLSTRKPCCTDGNESPAACGQSYERDAPSSTMTTHPIWEPFQAPSGLRLPIIPQAGNTTSSANLEPTTSQGLSNHQRIAPAQSKPLSPRSVGSQNNPMFDHDNEFMLPNQAYSVLSKTQYSNVQQPSIYVPTTSSPNVNNCNYAADMITTMAGMSDSSAVRADLGCGPGMDCEVDNQLVFNVMDRYSGVGL
ncbi:uncharacterized protein RSE6_05749 [Rhynchosporium secalis]|uniref:BZIP domain-containing protein n=1 Tax=Rhynchosporium secalis TaxID=38038 RepID=A0A1E1M8L7_RHYSE|nr:uncharacterized protein RSE6_05749 [Rhynchosporium secalis]